MIKLTQCRVFYPHLLLIQYNPIYAQTEADAHLKKNSFCNALGTNIPSPFKKYLFWPDETNKKKNIRKKDKVPSAVTSSAWKKYHQKKNEEKARKLKEKEQRAQARTEKKMRKIDMKMDKKKKSVIKKKQQVSSSSDDTDVDIQYQESDESDYNVELDEISLNDMTPQGTLQKKRKRTEDTDSDSELPLAKLKTKSMAKNLKMGLKKGVFVIVTYEGEYFPGKIENTDRERYEISTMTLSTKNSFRWPERVDKIWYPVNDIVK